MSSFNTENNDLKAQKYDLLSQYYKYSNPELSINYYLKHLHYMNQLRNQKPAQKVSKDRSTIGKLRFFHALSPVKNIDMYLNGTRIFRHVPFKSASHYLSLPDGKYQIDLYSSGQLHTVLLSRKIEIKEGAPYTVIATGNKKASLFSIEDNLSLPSKETKLNCLNLNPESGGIDIAVTGGDTIFSNLAYKKPSSYLGLTPMTIELLVKCSKSKELIFDPFSVTLHPDQIYTMAVLSTSIDHKDVEILFI